MIGKQQLYDKYQFPDKIWKHISTKQLFPLSVVYSGNSLIYGVSVGPVHSITAAFFTRRRPERFVCAGEIHKNAHNSTIFYI